MGECNCLSPTPRCAGGEIDRRSSCIGEEGRKAIYGCACSCAEEG